MADGIITNIDNGTIELDAGKFRDELLVFAGADTFVKGTLLARRAVANAVTASAVTGTGDGTVTLATVAAGPVVPLVGIYVLNCITAVTHGGIWELVDPNGSLVATNLVMTASSGVSTAFEAAGLLFTITDAAADFAVDDTATLTVAADGKMVPYDPAGDGGEQRPTAVLTYDVTRAGSGNEPVSVLIAGEVNRTRLIIDVDQDGDEITAAILDELRSAGIVATVVTQLAELDNQ